MWLAILTGLWQSRRLSPGGRVLPALCLVSSRTIGRWRDETRWLSTRYTVLAVQPIKYACSAETGTILKAVVINLLSRPVSGRLQSFLCIGSCTFVPWKSYMPWRFALRASFEWHMIAFYPKIAVSRNCSSYQKGANLFFNRAHDFVVLCRQ